MVEFFHLNARFFPQSTRDHLDSATVLRLGVVPLGVKRVLRWFRPQLRLNVGFLNPRNRKAVDEVKRLVLGKADVGGIQVFAIDPAEFVEVLDRVYGVGKGQLESLPEQAVEPSLREWLKSATINP